MHTRIIPDFMFPKKDGIQVCGEVSGAGVLTPVFLFISRMLFFHMPCVSEQYHLDARWHPGGKGG
jgi:hypothetical protein